MDGGGGVVRPVWVSPTTFHSEMPFVRWQQHACGLAESNDREVDARDSPPNGQAVEWVEQCVVALVLELTWLQDHHNGRPAKEW